MKHAGSATLSLLEPLLRQLRTYERLTERKPGTFYLKSKAFLHFHEDPAGIFADVKLDLENFTRMRATSSLEQSALLAAIARCLER
ncbi:MAG TPA: hypothetical protein VEC06_01930 [Paucimonas sp.]|nr:hypothetical protein [Paucimonas sp.]